MCHSDRKVRDLRGDSFHRCGMPDCTRYTSPFYFTCPQCRALMGFDRAGLLEGAWHTRNSYYATFVARREEAAAFIAELLRKGRESREPKL